MTDIRVIYKEMQKMKTTRAMRRKFSKHV